ncbi:MAG: hypothetical protein U0176_18860 [Bacteroidia bacterium]
MNGHAARKVQFCVVSVRPGRTYTTAIRVHQKVMFVKVKLWSTNNVYDVQNAVLGRVPRLWPPKRGPRVLHHLHPGTSQHRHGSTVTVTWSELHPQKSPGNSTV